MKKTILVLGIIAATGFAEVGGQVLKSNELKLDTIYANDQKNIAMFFPAPIRQGITGSENFVFTYNREQEQHLGLLQATPGEESNLLVISKTGSVFSYIIKYSERLEKLNYFINDSSRIGKEIPDPALHGEEKEEFASESTSEKLLADKVSQYQNYSSHLLRQDRNLGNIKKQKDGVVLKVENISFNGEELYFEMKIQNNSPIDFEPEFLTISVETKKKGKKKSIQKLVQEPVFKYNIPEQISAGKKARFVYVVPKFSIGEDKAVVIDLNEKNGERDIRITVDKKFINYPN